MLTYICIYLLIGLLFAILINKLVDMVLGDPEAPELTAKYAKDIETLSLRDRLFFDGIVAIVWPYWVLHIIKRVFQIIAKKSAP